MDTGVSPGDPQVGQLAGSRNANKWNPLPVPGIELLLKVMLTCSAEGNGEDDMFNKGIYVSALYVVSTMCILRIPFTFQTTYVAQMLVVSGTYM